MVSNVYCLAIQDAGELAIFHPEKGDIGDADVQGRWHMVHPEATVEVNLGFGLYVACLDRGSCEPQIYKSLSVRKHKHGSAGPCPQESQSRTAPAPFHVRGGFLRLTVDA